MTSERNSSPVALELESPDIEPKPAQIRNLCGLYVQYAAVGFISSALPATLYGFFLGYLQVNSYVYATAGQVIMLPWSCKLVFGMLNDRFPIYGYRRKSYIAIGWVMCTVALMVLASHDMPAAGDADASWRFSMWMALAALGYIISDVAADGLTAELGKMENDDTRGTVQSNVYLARAVGGIAAALLVGLGMNGTEYNGSFDRTLTFVQVCAVLSACSAIMVPVSFFVVHEEIKPPQVNYTEKCYESLQNRGMFYIMLYCLLHAAIGDINTTAGGHVTQVWAGVHNLQAQLSGIIGNGIFIVGLFIVKRYLLKTNWRVIIAGTTVLLNIIDAVFTYFTVYDVIRNQYFYLGETVVVMVPAAARFMVTTFVVVEVAKDGQEGMTYSLLTMLHNLGGPMARAFSNQIFAWFDGLSDVNNYHQDTSSFRNTVAYSYALSYGCSIGALALLPLLPSQKAETHARLEHGPRSVWYGRIAVVLVVCSWIYAVTLNILAMAPAYSCLRIIGGSGC